MRRGWLGRLLGRRQGSEASRLDDDRLDIGQREAIERDLVLGASLEENLRMFRIAVGPSRDITVRTFKVGEHQIDAALLRVQGLSDDYQVHDLARMLGLGTLQTPLRTVARRNVLDEFKSRLLQSLEVREVATFNELWREITLGRLAIMFDGTPKALTCDVARCEKRAIEEPASETVIRGPREGFTESIRTNTALLRRRIKTPSLWFEPLTLGRLTRTEVAIAYIKGLAGEELLQEVRQRVSRIEIDGVLESSYVEEFIDDNPLSILPLVFRTERPDRVAAMLLEGRVAILIDNTPFVLVVPMDFYILLQAPDDYYEKSPIGSVLRLVRFVAFGASVLLPGSYVAAITFHSELIPTQLLLRIAAAREGVPFPVVAEVFLMETVFEFLREAGIRLPRAIGPAISIVGALVLGDAAVRSGIVSPIVVIVVAFTAIASFAMPTFSFSIAARLLRFVFIILGGAFGLFGIQFGVLALTIFLVSLRSFGQPYLKPVAPTLVNDLKDLLIRIPWPAMVTRPKLSSTKEPIRQPRRQWPRPGIEEEKGGGGESPRRRSRTAR